MSTRTPGLQPRSQYHAYWGIYADGTTLLPNQSGNPLSSPGEFDKLEEGDIAYSNAPGNEGLYVCTDPGGAAATPAATWVMLAAGGAVVQTIRDAHQIVVGQDTVAPFADVVGIDADFVDPGDGTQLQAALTAAAALVTGARRSVDVRLRPCAIVLPSAFLLMSENTKLIGADRDDCILERTAGGILRVVGINNVVEGITFSFLDDGIVGDQGLLQITGSLGTVSGMEVRDCLFTYDDTDGNPVTNTRHGIYVDTSATVDVLVENNEFDLAQCTDVSGNRVGVAMRIVQVNQSQAGAVRFQDNRISFGDMFRATVNAASESANPIVIRGNVHAAAGGANSLGAIVVSFNGPPPSPGQGFFRGPEILDNVISMFAGTFTVPPAAIVNVISELNNQRGLRGVKIVGNTLSSPNQDANIANGVIIDNNASGTPFIESVVIGDNVIELENITGSFGVRLLQSDPGYLANDAIRGVTLLGNVIRLVSTALQASKSAGLGLGAISKVTFNGNACFGTGAAQMVVSDSVDNVDFAIIGNAQDSFTASALDPSGTFEVAHNV